MSAVPPPPPPPNMPGQPYGGYPSTPPGTNGMAIASLVLSLLGLFCGIGAILGIIFGFVARGQIRQTGQNGSGMATAGIVIGIVTLVLSIVVVIAVNAGNFS